MRRFGRLLPLVLLVWIGGCGAPSQIGERETQAAFPPVDQNDLENRMKAENPQMYEEYKAAQARDQAQMEAERRANATGTP